ncbi:hypothetical protein L5M43_12740 [Shewanella sp. SW36]|uniref:hypothetical protein n=1 Tax=unclassified Shewanella TaxID=196818 RepID=UPI0021D85CF9|nr:MULTISPECIES: hypothetical protein [unclassified Shewanella]MCU7976119.1 hypothetical protein [Shewanella sp. SW36]MCU7988922.1 hypothetical protein [Shewanella sp. SW1]MCU8050598.1 hypothetical protein [Shewanella sp. SM43]
MIGNVIFIDDDSDIRKIYKKKLQRIFGDEYDIICPELSRTASDMLKLLSNIKYIVTYFIDEDLIHTGIADFMGSELIEKIRVNEPNVPIYIITSNLASIDEKLGDIEFAIDKNKWNEEEDKYAKRFLRHINTFRTIKTEQARRFDELFSKSLTQSLTEVEKSEYENLNVLRSKTLIDETIISDESVAELERQSKQLEQLYAELKAFKESGDAF